MSKTNDNQHKQDIQENKDKEELFQDFMVEVTRNKKLIGSANYDKLYDIHIKHNKIKKGPHILMEQIKASYDDEAQEILQELELMKARTNQPNRYKVLDFLSSAVKVLTSFLNKESRRELSAATHNLKNAIHDKSHDNEKKKAINEFKLSDAMINNQVNLKAPEHSGEIGGFAIQELRSPQGKKQKKIDTINARSAKKSKSNER